MFEFKREQRKYEIYGVTVGGLPGENPTVMIGSLFYKGQKIVEDGKEGVFDKEKAERIISEVEELTDKTGLPSMVDLVAESTRAAERYLDFVTERSEMPILLDVGGGETVCVESLQYAKRVGIMERIVLNSLTPYTKEQVYQKLREVNCESAVLLLYGTRAIVSSDKRSVLEELIPKAEKAGIKNVLVDTVVLDIATLGLATAAIYEIKKQYGYPAGCGAHNAVDTWKLKGKFVKKAVTASIAAANALPVALGADFVLYGPMENAKFIFPSIALIDTAYSRLLIEKGRRASKGRPSHKIE